MSYVQTHISKIEDIIQICVSQKKRVIFFQVHNVYDNSAEIKVMKWSVVT